MKRSVNSTLYVNNMSQACIFEMEISGQISDGKWENSRPYDHWKWVGYTELALSPKNYYTGWSHRKKYGIDNLYNEFMRLVSPNDFPWPNRMIYYGRFGTILDPKYLNNLESLRSFIEEIGFNEDINTLEDLKKKMPEYLNKYWKDEYNEIFSTENIQKFRNSTYGVKELKKDLKAIHKSVNTNKAELFEIAA